MLHPQPQMTFPAPDAINNKNLSPSHGQQDSWTAPFIILINLASKALYICSVSDATSLKMAPQAVRNVMLSPRQDESVLP